LHYLAISDNSQNFYPIPPQELTTFRPAKTTPFSTNLCNLAPYTECSLTTRLEVENPSPKAIPQFCFLFFNFCFSYKTNPISNWLKPQNHAKNKEIAESKI